MPTVGVRELKTRASEIVRKVRESGARYVITYRGRPIGVMLPLDAPTSAFAEETLPSGDTAWDDLTRLGEEIGRGWQSPMTSADLVSAMRR